MAKAKADKPNIFVRFGRKVKEIFSELKKVTWPTFGKVVKTTGVVLVVVLVFIVIYTAIDSGLLAILDLLTNLG
jgi:preprotein translocase subunit SecE